MRRGGGCWCATRLVQSARAARFGSSETPRRSASLRQPPSIHFVPTRSSRVGTTVDHDELSLSLTISSPAPPISPSPYTDFCPPTLPRTTDCDGSRSSTRRAPRSRWISAERASAGAVRWSRSVELLRLQWRLRRFVLPVRRCDFVLRRVRGVRVRGWIAAGRDAGVVPRCRWRRLRNVVRRYHVAGANVSGVPNECRQFRGNLRLCDCGDGRKQRRLRDMLGLLGRREPGRTLHGDRDGALPTAYGVRDGRFGVHFERWWRAPRVLLRCCR